jgi:hypothetical protein
MSHKLPHEIHNRSYALEIGGGTTLWSYDRLNLRGEASYIVGPKVKATADHVRDECAATGSLGNDGVLGTDGLPCPLEGHNGTGRVKGFTFTLVPEVRLYGNLFGFGRVGTFYYSATYDIKYTKGNSEGGRFEFASTGFSPIYGVGFRYEANPKASFSVECDKHNAVANSDEVGGHGIYKDGWWCVAGPSISW